MPLYDAHTADEIFVTSTAGGIMPVTRLDGRPVGGGTMGPLTRQLIEAYWQKHKDPAWSTAVSDILEGQAAHQQETHQRKGPG